MLVAPIAFLSSDESSPRLKGMTRCPRRGKEEMSHLLASKVRHVVLAGEELTGRLLSSEVRRTVLVGAVAASHRQYGARL